MSCTGYMGFVLPSSNLHSEFKVASFRGGSRKWVQGVLTWVLGADGPFWRSFARALFTVFVCGCFLFFVRVGFSPEVDSFVIRGEEGLEELLADAVFPTRVCWRSKSCFFRFFVELGAHGVGAHRGRGVLRAFSFAIWLVVWGSIAYAACLFALKASRRLA